jgi:hypothetical protein
MDFVHVVIFNHATSPKACEGRREKNPALQFKRRTQTAMHKEKSIR